MRFGRFESNGNCSRPGFDNVEAAVHGVAVLLKVNGAQFCRLEGLRGARLAAGW